MAQLKIKTKTGNKVIKVIKTPISNKPSRVVKKPTPDKVTPFQRSVYDLCSQIPRGKVTTYGRMAKALNSSPRAVGNALRRNPFAPTVPCHRVIANNMFIGGFQGVWDLKGETAPKKLGLLQSEGVSFDSRGIITNTQLVWDGFVSSQS